MKNVVWNTWSWELPDILSENAKKVFRDMIAEVILRTNVEKFRKNVFDKYFQWKEEIILAIVDDYPEVKNKVLEALWKNKEEGKNLH